MSNAQIKVDDQEGQYKVYNKGKNYDLLPGILNTFQLQKSSLRMCYGFCYNYI